MTAFDRLLNSKSTIISMATKAHYHDDGDGCYVRTTSPTIPMGCAVVASGLLVVPRLFVVAVVESPSVISGPPAVVMSVVPSSVDRGGVLCGGVCTCWFRCI